MRNPKTTKATPIDVTTEAQGKWIRLSEASDVLDVDPLTLRRAIGRAQRKTSGNTITCSEYGLTARKAGKQWRVLLHDAWRQPAGASSSSVPSAPT
jgi:hypothetical protein